LTIKDQLNTVLSFSTSPKRIISLVPSLTELLCDLGLTDRIVGVTKFCVHPESIRDQATVVGGTKKFNLKLSSDLNPDFVLASKEENLKHQVKSFSEKGVNVYTSNIGNFNDLKQVIQDLGAIFEIQSKSTSLIYQLDEQLKRIEKFKLKKNDSAAYLIWKNPYMAAGGDTFISYMLNKVGIKNAFAENDRYPVITEDDLKKGNIDLILLSSEPYPFKASHIQELADITKKRVILVDGEFFSWYGSRILHMEDYIEQLTSAL